MAKVTNNFISCDFRSVRRVERWETLFLLPHLAHLTNPPYNSGAGIGFAVFK